MMSIIMIRKNERWHAVPDLLLDYHPAACTGNTGVNAAEETLCRCLVSMSM